MSKSTCCLQSPVMCQLYSVVHFIATPVNYIIGPSASWPSLLCPTFNVALHNQLDQVVILHPAYVTKQVQLMSFDPLHYCWSCFYVMPHFLISHMVEPFYLEDLAVACHFGSSQLIDVSDVYNNTLNTLVLWIWSLVFRPIVLLLHILWCPLSAPRAMPTLCLSSHYYSW